MRDIQKKYLKHFFFVALTYMSGVLCHECGHYIGSLFNEHSRNKHISYNQFRYDDNWQDSLNFVNNLPVQDEMTAKIKYFQTYYYSLRARKSNSFTLVSGIMLPFFIGWFSFLLLAGFKKQVFIYPTLFLGESLITFSTNFFRYYIDYKWLKTTILTGRPDLLRFSSDTGLPYLTVEFLLCSVSVPALSYLFFNIIPRRERASFALFTASGIILGHILWFYFIGNLLLPQK